MKVKTMASLGAMAFALAVPMGAQSATAPAVAKPIAPLAWLVGGTWTADASNMGQGLQRIETHYQWSDNNAYVRFTTHFVYDKGTVKNYDGSFFWNPEQKRLAMWYMDAANTITQGPVTMNGDVMLMMFGEYRATVTRKNNDDYTWVLEQKQDAAWKQLATFEYRRTSGS